MSSTRATRVAPRATPRIRHQARDALAVMCFSLVASAGLAVALLVLTLLLRPGR